MQRRSRTVLIGILAACSIIAIGACSQKPVFQVNYLLPQTAGSFDQKQVHVTATDGRGTTQFLKPGASRELKGFSGLFSLVVLKSDGIGDLVGGYEIIPLMKALCEQRLLASAVAVSEDPTASATRFEIVLKEFALDYADRKWVANIKYEAIASDPEDTGNTRRQVVNGSAERVKLWGNQEAEKLIGELVSDTLNQLDLDRLLGKN